MHALLEIADTGEVLVEPLLISASQVPLQGLGLIGDRIQNALSQLKFAHLVGDFGGVTLYEHSAVYIRCAFLAGDQYPRTRPG